MAVSRLHPSPVPHHQQTHHHHHHIASTLMSCVRESSPVEDLEEAECGGGSGGRDGGGGGGAEGRKQGRHDTKKRRFHPLRGLRRIFRRKSRRSPEDGEREVLRVPSGATSSSMGGTLPSDDRREAGMACGELDEAYRSRSASELLSGEEDEDSSGERNRRRGSGVRTSGEIFQDSLRHSVSHDSVFSSGERRVSSGGGGNGTGGGRTPQPLAPSSSAQQVTANQGVRAELFDAVRRRRWRGSSKDREQGDGGDGEGEGAAGASAGRSSDEEEDLGLPRSPCNSPSSGEAGLRSDQKEIQSKSHSTCSEGSLLSMGSSDMDEDSQGHFSGHSSKLSLHEKSSSQYGSDLDLDVGAMAEPLSHSAARHKMAVRPKRTHGAPRLRRLKEVTSLGSLPTTPEVNEDSGRCSSPETSFNQETSSNEQLSSDNPQHSKRVSTSSATTPAVEMPPRAPQSHHQSPNNIKSDHSPSHFFPESLSPTSKSSHQSIEVGGQVDSHETETKDDEFRKADVCGSVTKASPEQGGWEEESTMMNTSVEHVEEIAGVEEHETGGTNLLSRILSWRGSKKKVEESPEGATVASEGAAPSRRMDVHGRYVHEVICETTDSSSCDATEQTPPSPGWRPAPFSTSWPPLAHSTPRPIQMSSSHITAPSMDKEKEPSEEPTMWASVEFSGPHSLPLILQDDEMRNDRPNLTGKGQQAFSYTPGPFSVKSKTMPFTTRSETPNEVTLLKSSSLKAYRPEQHNVFYSTDAPESLPVQFERSECHFSVYTEESTKIESIKPASMGTPPRESVLKSSVEGLLTLDLGGESEMIPSNMSTEDDQGGISADDEGTGDQSMEDWGEGQRETDEEILLSSYDSIEEKGVVESVESIEPMVTLRHTKKEPEIEQDSRHCPLKRNEDSLKRQGIMDVTSQVKIAETAPPIEEQSTPTASSTPMSGASRYKRTQSMPSDSPLPKSLDVPEFLRVQLIHVDSRPTTNVVLHSTGGVPVSVNPPESLDTPGRRRMRPRSADSLERSQTEPSVSSQMGSKFGGGIVESSSNSSIGSDKGSCSQRIKVTSKESVEVVQQIEASQPKDTPVPASIQKKPPEVLGAEKEVSEAFPVTEKESKVNVQSAKASAKESFGLASTPIEAKDASLPNRRQRKVSDETSNRGSIASVVSVKEKEDVKPKPLVRESLGTVAVQNDANKPKEATLPPRGLRKVSGDEVLVEVVPRRKSTSAKEFGSKSKDDEPELFKVFARRSLKLKDSDSWENHPPPQQQKSRDSDKENDSGDNAIDVVILPVSKEQKQRDSLIKAEFIRDTEISSKACVSQAGDIPHHSSRPLQRIPSSNGIVPPVLLNTGNVNLQNNSVFGSSEKTVGIVSETPKHHRASVTGGSLQRREGPSPEKRPRGISINLPPESQPIRVEMNRVVGIPFEPRRPSWAAQMHSDESFVKPVASDMSEVRRQPVELGMESEEDSKPHFKRIQQRKEEWELRARMK